jgi:hypothetical protein
MQFTPNPDLKTSVDHINGNRQDYNISDLKWVTPRENGSNKHKKSIQTFQKIEIKMTVEHYGKYKFKTVFFDGDLFYRQVYKGECIRLKYHHTKKSKSLFVQVTDITNKQRSISKRRLY